MTTTQTISREWLQKTISEIEAMRDEMPFGLDEDENKTLAALKLALSAMDSEPVAYADPQAFRNFKAGAATKEWMWCKPDAGLSPLYTVPPAPVAVPDKILCDFYEVNNWPDLVRELVKHVEQLQDAAKRNVKPWEDTFPETLLPAYIDKIKQADEAYRAAMQAEPVTAATVPDGWTANADANDALVMLDRIDTIDCADDERIESVKNIIRRLAAAPEQEV